MQQLYKMHVCREFASEYGVIMLTQSQLRSNIDIVSKRRSAYGHLWKSVSYVR